MQYNYNHDPFYISIKEKIELLIDEVEIRKALTMN